MTATVALDRLRVPADPGGFTPAEVDGVDEPVRRYLMAAIAPGTPLARAAQLEMTGTIRLGNRWVPFRSTEVLAPLHGYRWPAVAAWGMLRGSDTYYDGEATMLWKLLGVIPVIRARGPELSRSAAGRAAAEAVWVPTALLPRYGTRWRAVSDEHLIADVPIAGQRIAVHIRLTPEAHVRSVHLDRWTKADGTGDYGWHPFGADITKTQTFACGLTMPAQGVGGWFHETDRWLHGQFMRYEIHDLTLL